MDCSVVSVDKLTLEYAKSFLGDFYRWGGDDPSGWDCSGLCIEILKGAGVLPHHYDTTAKGLYYEFKDDWITSIYAQPGALAFYGRSFEMISHVGFCVDHFRMIEAGGGNSKTLTVEDAISQDAFVRLRPCFYRNDFLTFLLPNYPLKG